MHIGIISPYVYSYFDPEYGPTSGGAQRQQYLISKQLVDRGHKVSFVVGDFGQPETKEVDGITLRKGAPTNVNGPLSIGTAAVQLLSAMRSTNADVFLVRGSPKLTAATYCCTKLLRKPLVFRLANDSDINPNHLESKYAVPIRRLYRRSVRDAAAVMTQTTQQQKALKHEFGVSSRVVTNAYDLPAKDELVAHENRKSFLWVGSSDADQKKPERFLDLASSLPSESFEMISKQMPNDNGYHEELRQRAEEINNLNFIGEVSPSAVHEHYKKAKSLVNTSDYEGFPNTFLEAWRYETPIISLYFDLDGVLTSNNVGILSGNTEQLISDTQKLSDNPNLRSQMGSAGRKLVSERYTISTTANEYEKTFENVHGESLSTSE